MPSADTVIDVEQLAKRYLIGHGVDRPDGADSFRDVASRVVRALVRRTADMARGRQMIDGDAVEPFWALKDVSFQVRRGEAVGIIGRNGAGKSTLLKVLSRITEPTEGRVRIRGRVASLLEVGTGFHPELSGRENIFLNGAVLGMSKREIARKFDEIVAFAEIERFLDTPVKRYSSGMYVRLAFAVAAHLEPDILVVDEVLAVGDAAFQKKCMGKMSDITGGGRTVLFVSHSMAAIRRLCRTAILLEQGRVGHIGRSDDTIARYLTIAEDQSLGAADLSTRPRRGSGEVRIEDIVLPLHPSLRMFEPLTVCFRLRAPSPADMKAATVWMLFRSASGEDVLMLMQKDSDIRLPSAHEAGVQVTADVVLRPGRYAVACGVLGRHREIWDWIDGAATIEVEEQIEGTGPFDSRLGLVSMRAGWRVVQPAGTGTA